MIQIKHSRFSSESASKCKARQAPHAKSTLNIRQEITSKRGKRKASGPEKKFGNLGNIMTNKAFPKTSSKMITSGKMSARVWKGSKQECKTTAPQAPL